MPIYCHKDRNGESLIVCDKFSNSPCFIELIGEEPLTEGHRYRLNDDVRSIQVRFHLYRMLTRNMHSVLEVYNRIPPQSA